MNSVESMLAMLSSQLQFEGVFTVLPQFIIFYLKSNYALKHKPVLSMVVYSNDPVRL